MQPRLRTVRVFQTAQGNTFLHLCLGDAIVAALNLGKSLHNPTHDWQVLLGYMADWIEDGLFPITFE